jgi:hypothetical protein
MRHDSYSLSCSARAELLRIAEDEPEKAAIKANGLFFQEKEKRLSESKYVALTESHVPCFQERVGTRHRGYMIPDRLPWRLRARPSATLHEIGSAPKSELVGTMVLDLVGGVKGALAASSF